MDAVVELRGSLILEIKFPLIRFRTLISGYLRVTWFCTRQSSMATGKYLRLLGHPHPIFCTFWWAKRGTRQCHCQDESILVIELAFVRWLSLIYRNCQVSDQKKTSVKLLLLPQDWIYCVMKRMSTVVLCVQKVKTSLCGNNWTLFQNQN